MVLTITPVTVVVAIVIVLSMIFAVRAVVFELYTENTILGLEALAGEISCNGVDSPKAAEILERARVGEKYALVFGRLGNPTFAAGDVEDPLGLLKEAVAFLGERNSAARITGAGPTIRLLAATRVPDGHILVLLETWKSIADSYIKAFLLETVFILSVLFVAIFFVSRRIFLPLLRRIKTLESAMKRYGSGDKAARISRDGAKQDEFDLVFQEFNSMADTIEKLEAEKKARAEAEKTLLAGLAHDINTPITILRGHAENLVERESKLLVDERRQVHTEILEQSLYVQALVDDLLTMASARTAGLTPRCEEIALDPLFDSIVDTFQPLAESRGVSIIADGEGLTAWADPIRLRQIVTNLVFNSLLHAGGATVLEVLAGEAEDGSLLTVRDNGEGVPDDLAPDLFTHFKRGENKKAKGWGLGLAIVRMLTELHGGSCRYVSGGGGACFEIRLPRAPDDGR